MFKIRRSRCVTIGHQEGSRHVRIQEPENMGTKTVETGRLMEGMCSDRPHSFRDRGTRRSSAPGHLGGSDVKAPDATLLRVSYYGRNKMEIVGNTLLFICEFCNQKNAFNASDCRVCRDIHCPNCFATTKNTVNFKGGACSKAGEEEVANGKTI